MKKFLDEFKEFALKGNVIDMAVGVIVGGAFSTIVSSLVTDIFTPVLGLATGNINFSELYVSLDGIDYPSLADAQAKSAPVLAYGNFIQNIIQFIILAFIIFLFVKGLAKLKKPKEAAPAETKVCPYCCSEIPIKASKCAHCGSELPDVDMAKA
ncbi:large conductance mechanosensitive channel [Acetitomaculum ruminis DSM 5522]|uniref:Large-conductance mechanosensitive channel n=1 Tax=Acetitomaculum ruminis DSM 5522 TaxID=1120918 RepID=A0A1I0YVQ9_9FIRM|nr:large conductance mechanosensitive channel protein MscL [Acetitomaculum ruminis]SFB17341.1 large conductance mechanosensitive channel [Acetitomaculum ruminis DSM 5522]